MGPGVSMGPMTSSEPQPLPSNVMSKQAGSMEVIFICIKKDILSKAQNIKGNQGSDAKRHWMQATNQCERLLGRANSSK